jgi:hypothetical protein
VKASQKTTEIYFPVYPKINLPIVTQQNTSYAVTKDSTKTEIDKPKAPNVSQPNIGTISVTNGKLNTPKPSPSTTIKTSVKPKPKQPVKPEATSPAKKEIPPNSETDEFEF